MKRISLMCALTCAAIFGFTLYPGQADAQNGTNAPTASAGKFIIENPESERASTQTRAADSPIIEKQGRFIVETAMPDRPSVTPQPGPVKRARSIPREFRVDQPIYLQEPLDYGYYFWDERYFKASGRRGPVQIVIDLDAEQLYVYRANIEIARTKVTRGWDQHETPTGTFPILEKDKDHYSSTYNNAPMPYNLRLTWPGVAIHGADVDNISATHGCIGVPLEFAEMLFANTRVGDKVLITRNWQPEIYGSTS